LSARCPTGVPGPIAEAGDAARPVASGTADGAPIEVWRGGPDDAPVLVALDSGCQVVSTRPVG
ncbi:MAG TPA: hypothetical protein VJM49_16715, partial [Acidimicrobiales bacterium]|nr:hypothetical protein [Acidimicrobiales bacterium]